MHRPEAVRPTAPENDAERAKGEPALRSRLAAIVERTGRIGGGGQGLIAFLAYLLFAVLIWGLPVLTNLSEVYVGRGGRDPQLYVWSLAWWPHALLNGQNPLLTDALWAPDGVNLAWVTSIPGPSILLAPITRTLGPVASLNILMLLQPALSGWAAFLVARRVTGSFWASLAGGYLFGFSTYQVAQMWGHVNLGVVFPVPLAVYLVLRRQEDDLKPWWFVVLLALVLIAQFSVSTEVFATMTLFGGIALVGALAFLPERRRLLVTIGLIALAYLVTAAAVSPFLAHALGEIPPAPLRNLDLAGVDLLAFVIPRETTLVGGPAFTETTRDFTVNFTGDGAYLGPALLLIMILFAAFHWRHRSTWLLLAFALLAAVLALGTVLHVGADPKPGVPMPWRLMSGVPLIQNAVAQRFVLYMWASVSVIVALWLAGPRRGWAAAGRWALVVAAPILLLPDLSSPYMHGKVHVPSFFADGTYRQYIRPGETVMTIPLGHGELDGADMHWQAITDMYFRLADGHIGFVPEQFEGRAVNALRLNRPKGITPELLAEVIARHGVNVVVVPLKFVEPWRPVLRSLRVAPVEVGGVVVYRLPKAGTVPGGG
jgi:hypothetical protein